MLTNLIKLYTSPTLFIMMSKRRKRSKFTINWQDFYDYLRCPKILSFECAGVKSKKIVRRREPLIESNIVGDIGEKVTQKLLPRVTERFYEGKSVEEGFIKEKIHEVCTRIIPKVIRVNKERVRSSVISMLYEIAEGTVKGIVEVGKVIAEKYGVVELVGRGELKDPTLPSFSLPDFLFKVRGEDKYILLEVKNSKTMKKEDEFQAKFYANLVLNGGLAIKENFHFEEGKASIIPLSSIQSKVDVFLLYPRLKVLKEVSIEKFDFKNHLLKIWEAKLLGFMGKQPEVEKRSYCRRCPWKEYCSNYGNRDIPVSSLEEIPVPLHLLLAKSVIEVGYELDSLWLARYLSSHISRLIDSYTDDTFLTYPMFEEIYRELFSKILSRYQQHDITYELLVKREVSKALKSSIEEVIIELFSNSLNVDNDIVRSALFLIKSSGRNELYAKVKRNLLKEFYDEVSLTSKIHREKIDDFVERMLGELFSNVPLSSTLPKDSIKMISKSWRYWEANVSS